MPARTRVILLRGNGGLFSGGFADLNRRFREAGFDSFDCWCRRWRWAVRSCIADPPGRLVFVGHSCGAKYAFVAARRLQTAGIAIDLVVCLDSAFHPQAPANVRRVVHAYWGGPRFYPAKPVTADSPAETSVENIRLDEPGAIPDARGLNHLTITSGPSVRDWVFASVAASVGPAA